MCGNIWTQSPVFNHLRQRLEQLLNIFCTLLLIFFSLVELFKSSQLPGEEPPILLMFFLRNRFPVGFLQMFQSFFHIFPQCKMFFRFFMIAEELVFIIEFVSRFFRGTQVIGFLTDISGGSKMHIWVLRWLFDFLWGSFWVINTILLLFCRLLDSSSFSEIIGSSDGVGISISFFRHILWGFKVGRFPCCPGFYFFLLFRVIFLVGSVSGIRWHHPEFCYLSK